MASTYAGSLQPKKKAELKDIASALGLSDDGNRDDLQARIKKHLDRNQRVLEEDPRFMGLFGKKKGRGGSEKPRSPDTSPSAIVRVSRRVKALDPVHESTPAPDTDPADVSSMLKNPFSPHADLGTPSSLPPLPPSPSRSILSVVHVPNSGAEVVRAGAGIVDVVRRREENVVKQTVESVVSLRAFLSNSRNIWSLTALFELLYILYTIIPLQRVEFDVTPSIPLVLYHPTLSTFTSSTFWAVLGHWAIPALFIPALCGKLISFSPPTRDDHIEAGPRDKLEFDALTASIVRLAAQIAYPFSALDVPIERVDVLGQRWRVLDASVGVAFAFAELITRVSARSDEGAVVRREEEEEEEEPHDVAKTTARGRGRKRRAIMGDDTVVGEIE